MMQPGFWMRDGWAARALEPIGRAVAWFTARRLARPGWQAPVPVLCCGNAGVGGAGKTTVVLDLAVRLRARGIAVHCLTRGYGGRTRGPLRVEPGMHDAALVGDEPLLLAAVAPTWVGADRAGTARLAVAAGAEVLLMDDGLQNPSLVQDAALLVIDGAVGFGNGRVMPAGPLREPVAQAASRCQAAVMIGEDRVGAARYLPRSMPILHADLVPDRDLTGLRVVAFAGIARPGKFHATLRQAGAELVATIDFPDHHRFTAHELDSVLARCKRLCATAITTPKDAVRLDPAYALRIEVAGVSLRWAEPEKLDGWLGNWTRFGSEGSRTASG